MMSNWLTDDSTARPGPGRRTRSTKRGRSPPGIEEQEPTEESPAGLPMRRPGSYLIPGAVDTPEAAPVATGSRRDPETIRRNLNRHQKV